jgi:alpha/beta superfamily hydrolase
MFIPECRCQIQGGENLTIEPFYFGEPAKLFGIYHPAQIRTSCDAGVVLCYPTGQEYIRSHRSLVRLAEFLSSAGFHVLRFDYYSCGDSEGDCHQGSIRRWVDDISTAVNELNGGYDLEKVCLVGLRLGGALAMMAGANRGDIESIVVWDPVIDGAMYLSELRHQHDEWLRGSFAKTQLDHKHGNHCEVLGFPMTDYMKEELTNINLLKLERKPANNVFIVASNEVMENMLLKEHLERINAKPGYEYISAPKVWIKNDNGTSKGLVPIPILKSIINWISTV